MSFTRTIPTLAASLAVVLAVAACGGGSTPAPSSGASGAPSTEPSAEPSTGASAQPSAEPSSGGASAAPSIDVGGAAAALEDIDSYRMKISSDAGTFEALVIRKPEPAAREITITNGTDVTKMIIIGEQAWLAEGDGGYTEVPAAMVGGLTGMFDPLLLVGVAEGWGSGWALVGTEEKNGVQARHLRIDDSTIGAAIAGFPAGAAVDIWVAEDGYLVAWESTGLGADTTIDISNVNDPANKVEAPG